MVLGQQNEAAPILSYMGPVNILFHKNLLIILKSASVSKIIHSSIHISLRTDHYNLIDL